MSKSFNPDADHDYTMDYDLLDSLSIILLLISVSKVHALLQPLECYYMYYLNCMHNDVYIQFILTHRAPLLTGHCPSQTAPPNQ